MTRKPYRGHGLGPTHGFLLTVTFLWPHYCRQSAKTADARLAPARRKQSRKTPADLANGGGNQIKKQIKSMH
jgi:hypothetical protein